MMTSTGDSQERSLQTRMGWFYAAYFTVVGLQTPYLPLWLDWRNLNASEIAIVTAVPMFVRTLVSPAIAVGSDRLGEHRRVAIVLGWASLAALLVLTQSSGFWPILALRPGVCVGVDQHHAVG